MKKFTPRSVVDKTTYKNEVLKVRKEGIAFDNEEYIEGIIAFRDLRFSKNPIGKDQPYSNVGR